jgi:hypothetical protein
VKKALVLALAVVGLVVSGAGCGDNIKLCNGVDCPDANQNPDGMPDGDITNDFTAFVHDLVLNHTNPTEDPAPYASFETLTDNDLDDDTFQAYSDLF